MIVFPNRGDLPPDQPGYTRDPRNPRIFRLTWIPCIHRYIKTLPCCNGRSRTEWCKLLDKKVTQHVCNGCDVRES